MRTRRSPAALLVALAALLSGALAAYAAPLAQPAPGAARQIFLPLVTKGGTAAPTPTPNPNPNPGGPSSDELIAAALARGEIDAESALVYRVFVAYADPRLPAKFHGDDSRPGGDDLMGEVEQRLPQLSPATRATLKPFTIPPIYPGSWHSLRRQPALARSAAPASERSCDDLGGLDIPPETDWRAIDSEGGHVRIWWQVGHPEDAAKARALVAIVETIWQHLHDLMGREPPHDGGSIRHCRGGNDSLDISLVEMLNAGEVNRFDRFEPQPGPAPTFMLINRDLSPTVKATGLSHEAVLRATLIHELMHVFQHAYDVGDDYRWWQEATATWAVHYVETLEPRWRSDYEHTLAPNLLKEPEIQLHFEGYHQYGAYLFPFFWQLKNGGDAAFIRSSFERSESISDSLMNLNGMLDGGFQTQFPAFVLRNFNTEPVDDYLKADGLKDKVTLRGDFSVALGGERSHKYPLDGNVAHLASHHYHFSFPDATARSVVFRNPYAEEGTWPSAAVQALVKVGGKWHTEDWTAMKTRSFCRDVVTERVEELYVVLSNSEYMNRSHKLKPAKQPQLFASNVGCRGWQGVVRYHDWSRDEVDTGVYLDEQTVDFATNVSLKLTTAPFSLFGEALHFSPAPEVATQVHYFGWGLDGHEPPRTCTFDQHASLPLQNERSRLVIYGDTGAYGAEGDLAAYTIDGSDSCGNTATVTVTSHWWQIDDAPTSQTYVSPDGTHISGRYDKVRRLDNPNAEIYYTWDLTALPPE